MTDMKLQVFLPTTCCICHQPNNVLDNIIIIAKVKFFLLEHLEIIQSSVCIHLNIQYLSSL